MEDHIKTVAMHYRGRCDTWDVVNEVVEEDGTLRKNIWHDTIGPEYIDLAFRYAAKYDPKAKLYYNDYGIEVRNQKSDGSIKLIRDLKSRGIPIHGVGFQCHIPIALPTTYEQFRDNLARFERLGVNLAVTELDSFLELPGTTEKYAAQAIVYANVAKACLVTRACIGVTTWNFYDPFSWVPGTVPGNGEAHLWWGNYTKKPAYYAIEELLNGKRVGS
jgi:endo-1,4-beta-xylanase